MRRVTVTDPHGSTLLDATFPADATIEIAPAAAAAAVRKLTPTARRKLSAGMRKYWKRRKATKGGSK